MSGPKRPTALLLHGFAGSPFEMQELGTRLERRGFAVRTPALPGHATDPGDLHHVKAEDYFNAAEAALADVSSEGSRVYVVGLSMGGTLGLHLAASHELAGLVTISTPVTVPPFMWAGVPILGRLAPDLRVPSRIGPRLSGDEGYGFIPVASVTVFLEVLDRVRRRLAKVTSPLLVVHSVFDPTIPVDNSHRIHDSVSSHDRSKHIIRQGLHLLTRPKYVGFIEPAIGEFLERLESSHAPASAQ